MQTFLPSASGHVLPLPSSASRGIGGCHLPPLGEGRGNVQRPCRGRRPDAPAAAVRFSKTFGEFAGRVTCLTVCCAERASPFPAMRCCAFAGRGGHPKRPHPFPPPAGEGAAHKGGRRGRTRRDRNVEMTAAGGKATVLPLASGQVLPLPSSASRGIGGCHLPPLGEGNDGCGFARGWLKTGVLLRGAPGSARPTKPCITQKTQHHNKHNTTKKEIIRCV